MASLTLLLLHLLLLTSAASAWFVAPNYRFYGGSVTFTPKQVKSQGTYEVEFRNKQTTQQCNQNSYACYHGDCGSQIQITKAKIDKDSYGLNWCQYEVVTKRKFNSNKPFSIRYPAFYNFYTGQGLWIQNMKSSGAYLKMMVHVDLGTRSDTGESNRSPITTTVPILRVPKNCPRKFNMTVFDPDGDQVRCRAPTVSNGFECGLCGLSSGFTLDPSSCSLMYTSTTPGFYPVELVVEDFPNKYITLHYSDRSYTSKQPFSAGRVKRYIRVRPYPTYTRTTTATTTASTPTTTATTTVSTPTTSPTTASTTASTPTTTPTTASTTASTTSTTASTPTTTPTTASTTASTPTTTPTTASTTTASTPTTTPTTASTTTASTPTTASTTTASTPTTTPTTASTTTASTPTTASTTTASTPTTTPTTASTTTASTPTTTPTTTSTTASTPTTASTTASTTSTTASTTSTTASTPTTTPTTASTTASTTSTTASTPTTTPTTASTTASTTSTTASTPTTASTTASTTSTTASTPTTTPTTASTTASTISTTASTPTTTPTTASTTASTTSTTASTPTTTPTTASTTASTTSTTASTPTTTPTTASTTASTTSTTASTPTTTPTTASTTAFTTARPLSKIPLQFSVLVDSHEAPSCLDGDYFPIFLAPTPSNGATIPAFVNRTLEIKVKSSAQYSQIHNLIISGPMGISEHSISTGDYTIKWTPTENELNDNFPICFVSEAKDRNNWVYQSELRCVIIAVAHFEPTVTCNETTITVEVEKYDLIRRNEDNLRLYNLTDPACSLKSHSNSTHLVAVVPLNTCGTKVEEDNDNIIFKNEITSADPSQIISRHHSVEIVFSCTYPKRTNLTLGYRHMNPYAFSEKGFGAFTFQFEFFESQRFRKQIIASTYPVQVYLKQMIFMQIEATTSIPNTELFVDSCRATPYNNPNSPISYTIIENGCVKDETVQVYPGSKSQFRFGMEAFEFIGAHEEVYITCSVILCQTGVPNTRCSMGCIKSSFGGNRVKREAGVQTSRHSISQGPLHLFQTSDNQAPGLSLNLGLNLVFIVGCLLVCGLVVYRARRPRAKYQLLPNSDSD